MEDVSEFLLAQAAGLSDNPGFDIYGPGGAVDPCVLTRENEDRRRVADNAGSRPCVEVAREVFDHFDPWGRRRAARDESTGGPGPLPKTGDEGDYDGIPRHSG